MAFRGNKPKKRKKGNSLYYPHTKEDLKRVGWCLNKNIEVAVIPGDGDWKVEIDLIKIIGTKIQVFMNTKKQ